MVEPSARNHLRRNYFFLRFYVWVEGSGNINQPLKDVQGLKTVNETLLFLSYIN